MGTTGKTDEIKNAAGDAARRKMQNGEDAPKVTTGIDEDGDIKEVGDADGGIEPEHVEEFHNPYGE